jgi:hypothetical protein
MQLLNLAEPIVVLVAGIALSRRAGDAGVQLGIRKPSCADEIISVVGENRLRAAE